MDEYTQKTKFWLEQRFKETDDKGIYKSHAPIYEFSRDQIFLGLYKNNFTILKEIERLISQYSIGNFLEVGCAEGYTSHLVERISGFKTLVLDLSIEAIKRAQEIYQLRGIVADAQALECIKSDSFDLVLCSETLEHLPNPEKAFKDLLRIAKKALIITVPSAKDRREKEKFVSSNYPHAHLHIFSKDDLKKNACLSRIRGISPKWLDKIESLFTRDGKPMLGKNKEYLEIIYKVARLLFLPLRRLYGVNLAKLFIKFDYYLGNLWLFDTITYLGLYLKARPDFNKKIKRQNIFDFMLKESKVNYHFLGR